MSGNTPVVIINNDSVLVTGDKLLDTFDRLKVAESGAKSLIMGDSPRKMVPINEDQVEACE